MKVEALKQELVQLGWRQDSYGHFQKAIGGKQYRIKLQATSCRLEVQVQYSATEYSAARKEWVKIDGAYFKDISKNDAGLRIGKRVLK